MDIDREFIGIEKSFYELSLRIVSECDLSLYHMEYVKKGHVLKLFVMDKSTKSAMISDCVKVDNAMTPHIEAESWMPEELVLEVSSPGVYRKLLTREQFETAIGERIALKLMGQPAGGESKELKKSLVGKKLICTLSTVLNESIFVDLDGKELEIKFSNIKAANAEPVLETLS